MIFPERHNLLTDLEGGKTECEECGHVGPVDEDGLCDACSNAKFDREIAEWDLEKRDRFKPKPDLTIYYPGDWAFVECALSEWGTLDDEGRGLWLGIPRTTTWKRWMPIVHPDTHPKWSLEIIFPCV